MKKWLSMALALALCLGLAAPALAVEEAAVYYVEGQPAEVISAVAVTELRNIADESPEVQEYLWQMYQEGLLQENTDYDLSYFADEIDQAAAYREAHPEEIAALDVDSLLAGWGYRDMTAAELFMDQSYEGETLAEAVTLEYIDKRLLVLDICQEAQAYREQYPQQWADFDADAYFASEWTGYDSKADYYAYWNILTQEEFVDDMFVDYVDTYVAPDDDWAWDYGYDRAEPTLTLMVNGVASEAQITAENGVSYVDAAELREILGETAVGADQTGPVAVRAAAEAAGWDVVWNDGGWWGLNQEIQLWDRAAYEARLAQEFGPLNDFMAKAVGQSMGIIFSDEPVSGHQTAEVKLTKFSTLDGNKDYTLNLAADYTAQKGVMDMTVTFDLSQLLQVFDAKTLEGLVGRRDFAAQFTQLLKAGKMEFILDYNTGVMAWNVPLLALLDESLAGWQSVDLGDVGFLSQREDFSFVSTQYAAMLNMAGLSYIGAEEAAAQFESTMALMAAFAGKDRFSVRGGKTTWTLTTQAVNEAMSNMVASEGVAPTVYSFFKAFDLTYTLDDQGNLSADMHIRPDMAGIAAAAAAEDGMDAGVSTLVEWFLSLFDMDIALSGSGSVNNYASRMSVHWNNVGKLDMTAKTTLGKGAKAPRQVSDVAPAPEPFLTAIGVIGGADGPTAILTTD